MYFRTKHTCFTTKTYNNESISNIDHEKSCNWFKDWTKKHTWFYLALFQCKFSKKNAKVIQYYDKNSEKEINKTQV